MAKITNELGTFEGTTVQECIELYNAVKALQSPAKASKARTSTLGSVKDGSAHDLWNKASDDVKATIIRTYIADNLADNHKVNKYTLSFLYPIKTKGVMLRDYVASADFHNVPDETLLDLAKAAIGDKFNASCIATIVRAYNTSARGSLVVENAL